MSLPAFEKLSKNFQRTPEVRALYMVVEFLDTQGFATRYTVTDPRTHTQHVCKIVHHNILCDCTAAKFGTLCAHKIAAKTHHEKENNMPVDDFYPPVAGRDEKEEYKQFAILSDGMYVGFLQRVFPGQLVPEQYRKKEGEKNQRVNFLVTHTIERDELPRFSLATARIKLNVFYSEDFGQPSTYFEVMHAIVAKKYSKAQLFEVYSKSSGDTRPNLNKLVGFPLAFRVTANEYEKDGETRVTHKASDFMPVSEKFTDILKPIKDSMKIESDDKGYRIISYPIPGLHDSAEAPKSASAEEDQIPF